ncbi:MAG: sulfatase-like hydrolase/transferase [Chthoniobacteraceae bacterium]
MKFTSCLSGCLASLILLAAARAEDRPRPNVLFIAVDDLKPAIGAYGDPIAKTPNIDRIAARGTLFERAYCMQAVCAPSRNSLLTGLRQETLRIYDLGTNFRRRAPEVATLPQHFKENGFQSHGIGKIFHVGHGNHEDAASWSVPHFQVKSIDYAKPQAGGELTREEAYFSNSGKDVSKLPRGAAYESADVPDDAYADGKIANEAITRLRTFKEKGERFFLALGFVKPHLPFCAPQKYWDLYDPAKLPLAKRATPPDGAPKFAPTGWGELRNYSGIPQQGPLPPELQRTLIHGYYAATSYIDAQIGRVLEELEAQGLAENTIIVLWGDHGWHLGDHGLWSKHDNYEEATRSPLLIAAPGKKSGQKTGALVEFVDIYPTLCDLAGIPQPPHLQGESLVPLLDDSSAKGRAAAFQVFPRGTRETGPMLGHAVRSDRWRYVEWQKQDGTVAARELYDMEQDAGETVNVAENTENAEVVKKHSEMLKKRLEAPAPAGLKLVDPSGKAAAPKVDRAALFERRDSDKDGKLTLEEFLQGQPDPKEAPKRFPRFDSDQDGRLTKEEFVAAGARRP